MCVLFLAFTLTLQSLIHHITKYHVPPLQPSLDLSKDKISPEKAKTSPETSPVSPGEEAANDQRGMPATESIIHEEGTQERKIPAATPPDPAISHGTVTM